MATNSHNGFDADEWEDFCRAWDDARYRLTGGKHGKLDVTPERKRAYISRELAASRKNYERACKRQDHLAARVLRRRISILEAMAKDYAER